MKINPINVATLGSCLTRDNFNSLFNPNYKEFYNCILHQHQTSIISLMSSPIPFNEAKIDNQTNSSDVWHLKTEFTKEFLTLIKQMAPSYLIIDFFADVYFGVIKINTNQFLTNNWWKLTKTSYYKELDSKQELKIALNRDEYFELWKLSIDKFFNFLKKELPTCQVILTQARFVDWYIEKETQAIKQLSKNGKHYPINIDYLNSLWDQLDRYVIQKYDVKCINLIDEKYISHEEHPWGDFYVHYTENYYHNFLKNLHEIVLHEQIIKIQELSQLNDILQTDNTLLKNTLCTVQDENKSLETTVSTIQNQTITSFISNKLKKY